MKKAKPTPLREHTARVTPEIIRMLNETTLTTEQICVELRVSLSTVQRRAKEADIDLHARAMRLGIRKYKERKPQPPRSRASAVVVSRVNESMTGDGYSLEWLSKEW